MRAILDEGVPKPLARKLRGHGIDVVPFPNEWKQLSNGALMDRIVAEGFNVLVTNDKNMQYQQSLTGRPLAVLVLPTNRLPELRKMSAEIAAAAALAKEGRFSVMEMSSSGDAG